MPGRALLTLQLLQQVVARPLTCATIGLLVVVWASLQRLGAQANNCGLSYQRVVQQQELWRLPAAQVCHADVLHLLLCVLMLWRLGVVEEMPSLGSAWFAHTSLMLMLLWPLVYLGACHVMVTVARRQAAAGVQIMGYSGVILGAQALLAFATKGVDSHLRLLGVPLPLAWTPWLSLLLFQLLVPHASFLGHLSGLLAGLLLATGVLDGLTGYWLACLVCWLLIAILWALAQTPGALSMAFVQLQPAGEDDVEMGLAADGAVEVEAATAAGAARGVA